MSSSAAPFETSPDEQTCVRMMREHNVDSKKLGKLLDQSVNQASALIAEYDHSRIVKPNGEVTPGKIPAALAKSFLGGIFSGTVTHTNERDQRSVQTEPLQQLVGNVGNKPGQTPSYFIDDSYLGKDHGIKSRLALIEKQKLEAEVNLQMVGKVAHDFAPDILEGIASDIKETSRQYTDLFNKLDKSEMAKLAALVQKLLSTARGNGSKKPAQPKSPAYPELSDTKSPLFMLAILKDAQNGKMHLDAFVERVANEIDGVEFKRAPLKTVERGMAKVYEKYGCCFDQLTDVARATIEAANEHALYIVMVELERNVSQGAIKIHRIKHRLDEKFDATEAGGYRDILINMSFPPSDHLVELQLNLKAFVDIKSGGGHASYSVGRMLQAFDPAATNYMGVMTEDRACDVKVGLIKKAAFVGSSGGEMVEAKMARALGWHSVQLAELKLLNLNFSNDMQSLSWLATSAKALAPTLKVLQINSCKVKGCIPKEVGELRQLAQLNLLMNELEGKV